MLTLRTSIPLLAFAILLVAPAEATTTYYAGASTEASFNTAVGGLTLLNTTLTFSSSNLAPGGLFNANGTGIDFLGLDDYHFNDPLDFTVNSGALTATAPGEQATINFPAGSVYAFGFHLTVTSGTGVWCIELAHGNCDYQVTNTSPSNQQFFGIVSNAPITASLYLRNLTGNPTMVFPNFQAYSSSSSSTSETPEPHTMLLVGLGLVILGMSRSKIWKSR